MKLLLVFTTFLILSSCCEPKGKTKKEKDSRVKTEQKK